MQQLSQKLKTHSKGFKAKSELHSDTNRRTVYARNTWEQVCMKSSNSLINYPNLDYPELDRDYL